MEWKIWKLLGNIRFTYFLIVSFLKVLFILVRHFLAIFFVMEISSRELSNVVGEINFCAHHWLRFLFFMVGCTPPMTSRRQLVIENSGQAVFLSTNDSLAKVYIYIYPIKRATNRNNCLPLTN